MAHGPLYDLKTEAELMELLESFASDAELMEAIRKMGITAELTELLEPFANDAELMELIKKMGITVEQTVSPVAPKHNIPPKWYGAQFHASDYRLHELALDFEFFEFGSKEKQPQPWALRDSHISKQHIFFSQLKREATSTSFDGILDRFSRISQQTFYDIADDMPKSWVIESSVRKILSHVCLVHDNVDKFRQGLLEALT